MANLDDEKLQKLVQGMKDGSLAKQYKGNMKKITNGILLGAVAGLVLSSFMHGNKLKYIAVGGVIGLTGGILTGK